VPPVLAATRIAAPPALLPSLEPAARGWVRPIRLVAAVAPAGDPDARQELRLRRIWLEHQRARGGAALDAESALRSGSIRAWLMVRDRQAEAALLDESDPFTPAAWQAIEPDAAHAVCADFWMASLSGTPCAWFDWPASIEPSPAVDQFLSAVRAASQAAGGALPLLLDFSNGRDPAASRWKSVALTLQARSPQARHAMLYSPLFYRDGRLDAAALLKAVLGVAAGALPVLCAPRLARADFAAALRAAGGTMSGRLRAGADFPAARLAADAHLASARATLAWLAGER